jgi:hypothetical protein
MANNFSSEASVKALWRFESGALTTDSKGANSLAAHNTPAEDGADYKEGACAVALVTADSDYFNVPDANLDAGFPFKSGDTTKLMSVCLHFKGTSFATSNRHLIGKWHENAKRSWILTVTSGGQLRLYYSSDGSTTNYYSMLTLTANRWYHIGFAIDGVNKLFYCKVVDATTGTAYTYTASLSTVIAATDSDLQIGCVYDSSSNPKEFLSGKLDEIVVFNRLIAFSEMDKIRLGTYDGSDGILVSQVGAEIEYLPTPQIQVSQLFAQVEWVPTDPNVHVYAGSIPISIAPQGGYDPVWTKTGQVTIGVVPQGEYFYTPPGEFEYHGCVGINISPQGQYQRGFSFRSPGIGITVSPQADYLFPDHYYESPGIEITITPAGVYRIPTIGWDINSGYGCVDFSALADPPPFWCIDTEGIVLAFDNTASKIDIYAEYAFAAQGGVAVGGSLAAEFAEPEDLGHLIGGGVAVGGGLAPRFVDPREFLHVVSGGVRAGGGLEMEFPEEEAPPLPYHRVLRRGVEVGGALNVQFVEVETLAYELVLSGGVAVGPFRRAPVEFYDPSDLPVSDPYVYEFGTWGGVKIEGVFAFEFPEGDIFAHEVRRGGVRTGGSLGVSFYVPKVAEHRIRGEVVIDGSVVEDEQVCETWALTGFGFEPSMYSPFPFNSYVSADGRTFALAENGLYLLEGDDDDGQPIHSGVRIGPANFGADNYKRLRAVYPGQAGNPEIRVRAVTKGKEEYRKLARERFNISVDVQDQVMLMELSDFDQLNQFEVVRVTLAKR